MRTLSQSLRDHLESGVTTICNCWRVQKANGVVEGFTDHDEALAFDGISYHPQSGLSASEAVSNLGLGADTNDVEGALQADFVSEEALRSGEYDNAFVTIFSVNWQSVDDRIVIRVAEIGEVTREDGHFRAELRGIHHRLAHVKGRLYENSCDADLGDNRCGVSLSLPGFQMTGTVNEVLSDQEFKVTGLSSYPSGYFDRGLVIWTSGQNTGEKIEVDQVSRDIDGDTLSIWLPMASAVAVNDTFHVQVGCDKQFSTCRDKFGNSANFRGFPHIPGNDFAYRFARSGAANTGKPLVK